MENDKTQAAEAEMAVVGSMILGAHVIGDVAQKLVREDFSQVRLGEVFTAVCDVYDKGSPVDLVTLKQHLSDSDKLKNIGGVEALIEIAESVPHPESAGYYASIVREKSQQRALLEITEEAAQRARETGDIVSEQVDSVISKLFAMSREESGAAQTISEILNDAYRSFEEGEDGRHKAQPTGFEYLDSVLGGLHKGEMIVVAGRPSMGKTALAMNILLHCGVVYSVPTLLFSMEMSKAEVGMRILSSLGNVPLEAIRRHGLDDSQLEELQRVVGSATTAPIFIDDAASLTITQLRTRARKLAAKHDIGLIVVDYIQLLSSPDFGVKNRETEVSRISRGLKALARELDIPIIVVSQLNRAAEQRSDNKPRLSDLRESGAIEQDADVVVLLHRPAYYETAVDPDKRAFDDSAAEAIVAKQRNGPLGICPLMFDSKTASFKTAATPAQKDAELAVGY